MIHTTSSFLLPGFGALEQRYTDFEQATVVILPIPYDLTTSYISGTRNGPQAIIEASAQLELYDEELSCEPYKAGIHTAFALEQSAAGPEAMTGRITREAQNYIKSGKILASLGGDHSLTIGVVNAFLPNYEELSVLYLDAHADMRNSYQETAYSHACVARRLSEKAALVEIGTRSMCQAECQYLKEAGIKTYSPQTIRNGTSWEKEILSSLPDNVYVSIDLDVLDSGIMPASGTPEPGGLDWYELLQILRLVTKNKKVVGFDIVELCPLPGQVAPNYLAAKLVYRFIGYLTHQWRSQ